MKKFMFIVAITMAIVVSMPSCGSSPLTEITVSGFVEPTGAKNHIYAGCEQTTGIPDSVKLVAHDRTGKDVVLASTVYNKNGFTLLLPQNVDTAKLDMNSDESGDTKYTYISCNIYLYLSGCKSTLRFYPSDPPDYENENGTEKRSIDIYFRYIVGDVKDSKTKKGEFFWY